jgi:hypothetical protein
MGIIVLISIKKCLLLKLNNWCLLLMMAEILVIAPFLRKNLLRQIIINKVLRIRGLVDRQRVGWILNRK